MATILQIGEGNFLRAFVEEYIQNACDNGYKGSVAICQPRTNNKVINALNGQNRIYDIIHRGRINGRVIDDRCRITCVSDCIDTVNETDRLIDTFCSDELQLVVSNTTEAGIAFFETDKYSDVPNVSFPGKIAYMLYQRYKQNKGDLVFLPVELIEDNGIELKNCILKYAKLWDFNEGFTDYVNTKCHFCNTLVDRIVTGHNQNDADPCSVTCEPYRLFIIDADDYVKSVLPFNDDTVVFTDNIANYRTRKVRILNGVHTSTVLGAYLKGFDIVRDMVNDDYFKSYISDVLEEIYPTIPLDKAVLEDYANSVLERFNNPFIDHKLLDISLNSVAKFKARVLPSILDYAKINCTAPINLSKSLAYLIAFYNHKSAREYEVHDSETVLSFFEGKPSISDVLDNTDFWGVKLTEIPNMKNVVEEFYNEI